MSALKQMALMAASRGRGGDRHLVHINDSELDEMRDRWGEPTINPDTGLPEFFLGGVLDAVTSILEPIAQIAGAVMPFFAPSGGVQQPSSSMSGLMPGVRNQQTGQYVTSPPVQMPTQSGGALGRLLGGSGQNIIPAALLTALDYFSQPDVPSVAEQLAEINAAQAASNPYWATPLPEVEYDRQSVSPPAGYDFGANPEFSFFTGNQMPTVKKAFGGLASPPARSSHPAMPYTRAPLAMAPPPRTRHPSRLDMPIGTRPIGVPSILNKPLSGVRRPMFGGKPLNLSYGYNQGGEMRAAGRMYHGPGGGQGDEIPAMLSDGEYVIDSTTVADLGDGDSDAGAAKLDQLRGAVARHKGRKTGVPPKAHGTIAKYLRAA